MYIFVQRWTGSKIWQFIGLFKCGHVESEHMDLLELPDAMTPGNGLFLNSGVPVGTDKIYLGIVGLQVEALTPSLNLQDKYFVVGLQGFTASMGASSAVK